ncbi:MAG: sugar phosphate isomerase/epimerase family protein [Christensenellales bacterium]|jgi:sugar phosphate isomerase/epimerase
MYKVKKRLPIGLQLYTLRNSAQKNLHSTLSFVKGLGYDGVELAGLYGLTAGQMKAALEKAGLAAISSHVPYAELADDMRGTIDKYSLIGCEYIAIPYLNKEHRPGSEGYPQVLENMKKVGIICREKGMTLLYHNHDFEFMALPDGRIALDALYEDIPADILQTQIDTCWAKVAGHDPAEYVRKYAGRCPLVHLKDFHLEGTLEYTPYELIGIRNERPAQFDDMFSFRPLGMGMQDMPALLDACADSGAKWLIVELDAPSPGAAPEEDVSMSIEYLRSLGL